jgi:hypothetical protein
MSSMEKGNELPPHCPCTVRGTGQVSPLPRASGAPGPQANCATAHTWRISKKSQKNLCAGVTEYYIISVVSFNTAPRKQRKTLPGAYSVERIISRRRSNINVSENL